MANFPVAVKFFPNNNKVVVLGALKNPNPNKLRVLKTAQMLVRLPDESQPRSVGIGRAKIIDLPAGSVYKLIIATFQYAAAADEKSGEEGDKGATGTSAQLEITITNTPTSDPTNPQELTISVEDPAPNATGNPPLDGPIDLYA